MTRDELLDVMTAAVCESQDLIGGNIARRASEAALDAVTAKEAIVLVPAKISDLRVEDYFFRLEDAHTIKQIDADTIYDDYDSPWQPDEIVYIPLSEKEG